jgi:hypothetical protein
MPFPVLLILFPYANGVDKRKAVISHRFSLKNQTINYSFNFVLTENQSIH